VPLTFLGRIQGISKGIDSVFISMHADGLPNVLLSFQNQEQSFLTATVNYVIGPQILSGLLFIALKPRFELKPTENDLGPKKYIQKVDCDAYIFLDFTCKGTF
jgi:hypothetical protein